MTDFLIVPVGHTFIMDDLKVIEQLQRFLREGSFRHEEDGENQSGQDSSK
jgi:hypothetical protein